MGSQTVTMAKWILQALARVPEPPIVRFFVKDDSPKHVHDVTDGVVRIVIEDLDDGTGACHLLRMDTTGKLVWTTRHPSLQETKWQAEFEYGVPEKQWNPVT